MNGQAKKYSDESGHDVTSSKTAQITSFSEYGRWQDVQRLFGIKRGILYRLMNDGKIRSITLREPGRSFGCRLIYLPSVRAYLQSLLEAQNPDTTPISPQPVAVEENLQ